MSNAIESNTQIRGYYSVYFTTEKDKCQCGSKIYRMGDSNISKDIKVHQQKNGKENLAH
ncbi:MAG: hypothetical protein GX435_02015 [Exilispira sp.]|nr:hypothetical protein [Exilispira sp.]